MAELLDWLLIPPAFFTTFPAGWGKLPPAIAGRLHACGLKPGMPDLLVFDVGRVIGIELKTKETSQSSVQRSMQARLTAVKVPVYICRSVEEVIAVLKTENVQVRKHWMDGATNGTPKSVKGATRRRAAQPAQSTP